MLLIGTVSGAALAQGTVRGKITDVNGETLIGATVVLKDDPATGTTADFDGNYSLDLSKSGAVVLVYSFIGFEPEEVTVEVPEGGVQIVNMVLKPKNFELKAVEVVAKARRSSDVYLERMKINSAASLDFISKDLMQQTGDRDVNAAVKRVTGVSQVGRFVTVRGLADRYVVSSVNGSRIPTLDPFTNNISLDLFPTGLVDNLVITKTATPDLPGDWAGAYLSINTKDYPERLKVSITTTVGYNANATFEDIVSSKRSSTDWLGYDDGYRGIPPGVPLEQEEFPVQITNPSLYQQLSLLGQEGFLNGYGIVPGTNIEFGDAYHLLALTNLGLLAPALINDPVATNNALNAYNNAYGQAYFSPILNAELEQIGLSFDHDNMWVTERQAPLNFSQSFSIGNQTKLFGRQFGFMFGFRYGMNTQYDADSEVNRTFEASAGEPLANSLEMDQRISQETAGWSALLNLSYKLNEHNSISLMAMPNFMGQNQARLREGRNDDVPTGEFLIGQDQIYEERQQVVYQLRTAHYLPKSRTKLEIDGSYTSGERNVLDFKQLQYRVDTLLGITYFETTFRPDRRYRPLEEELLDTRFVLEQPISQDPDKVRKLRFGGAYRYSRRETSQNSFLIQGTQNEVIEGELEDVFDQSRFAIQPDGTFDLFYTNNTTELDADIGIQRIYAGFAMADVMVSPRSRLVGGLRVEYTDMLTDIRTYYDQGLPEGDPGRRLIGGKQANPGTIDQVDLLPSAGWIYKLRYEIDAPMNLRVNYFRSLARPSFRELTNVSLDDFVLQSRVAGNADLRMTDVHNFDVRLESYYSSGNNVSVSLFYKTFTDHIEQIVGAQETFSWENADESYVVGAEIEGRVGLTPRLDLRGNLTLIQSSTTVRTERFEETRRMYGQAPYIVNTMLTYKVDSARFSATVSYNVQGPKLAIAARAGQPLPDVIELPRHLVDLTLSKDLGRHWNLTFRARDLLNSPVRRSYEFDSGYDLDFDLFRWGTTYSLSVSYNI